MLKLAKLLYLLLEELPVVLLRLVDWGDYRWPRVEVNRFIPMDSKLLDIDVHFFPRIPWVSLHYAGLANA